MKIITRSNLWKLFQLVATLITIATFFVGFFGEKPTLYFATFIFLVALLILYITAPKQKKFIISGTVSGDELVGIVSGLFYDDKLNVLKEASGKIYPPLNAKQLNKITKGLYSSDKAKAIVLLAQDLQDNLSKEDIELILDGLYSDDRARAAKAILKKRITKSNYNDLKKI